MPKHHGLTFHRYAYGTGLPDRDPEPPDDVTSCECPQTVITIKGICANCKKKRYWDESGFPVVKRTSKKGDPMTLQDLKEAFFFGVIYAAAAIVWLLALIALCVWVTS